MPATLHIATLSIGAALRLGRSAAFAAQTVSRCKRRTRQSAHKTAGQAQSLQFHPMYV